MAAETYSFISSRSICFRSIVRITNLEFGPMPNVMAALANIGGALCSTPQNLADAH